jgi:SnoaL-like domain
MNGANHQQVRLDEMDEKEAYRFLTELFSNLDPEEEYAVRHEDYVLEMPQSGERIRGRENMRAFQRFYSTHSPSDPMRRIRLRRVLVKEGLWVVEGAADYDDDGRLALDVVVISELRDGKMWRDRWYFAEPFEAPEWRSQWVERMETGAPPRDENEEM